MTPAGRTGPTFYWETEKNTQKFCPAYFPETLKFWNKAFSEMMYSVCSTTYYFPLIQIKLKDCLNKLPTDPKLTLVLEGKKSRKDNPHLKFTVGWMEKNTG